jgi:hypothetical protein
MPVYMFKTPSVKMVSYLQKDTENNSDLKEMITETLNRVRLTMASVSYLKSPKIYIPDIVLLIS